MPVASSSVQGKGARKRTSKRVAGGGGRGRGGERVGVPAKEGHSLALLSIFQALDPPSLTQSNKTRAINPLDKTAGLVGLREFRQAQPHAAPGA